MTALEHGRAGFTLIETLVALSVVALVAAISVPAFRRPSDAMRLEAAVRDMAAAMRLTRARAIASNTELDFTIDTADRSYVAPGMTATRLPSGIDVDLTVAASTRGSARGAVRFFADGGSSGAEVSFRVGRQTARIDVNWLTGAAVIRR